MTALDDPSGVLDATIEGLSEIAAAWRSQRAERLGRTALDRSDFDAIAKTGYVLSKVPVDEGATWIDAARSVRPISITGVKHFGSGMGITDWMITTARPDGSDDPAIFFFPDRRSVGRIGRTDAHRPLGRSRHGGHPEPRYEARPRDRRTVRARRLDPGDRSEGVTVQPDEQRYWPALQALEGALAAVESDDPETAAHGSLRGTQSIAELAEDIVSDLARTLGGGSFSGRSPFARWSNDVRALGFLRPPWGLAHDQLYETSW